MKYIGKTYCDSVITAFSQKLRRGIIHISKLWAVESLKSLKGKYFGQFANEV